MNPIKHGLLQQTRHSSSRVFIAWYNWRCIQQIRIKLQEDFAVKYVFLSLLFFVASSNAGVYSCAGKVDAISQPYNGDVILISNQLFGNGVGRTICSLGGPYARANTVQPDTCKAWLAKLIAAQARQASIVLQYNDTVAGQTCASQQNWNDATVPWAIWEQY